MLLSRLKRREAIHAPEQALAASSQVESGGRGRPRVMALSNEVSKGGGKRLCAEQCCRFIDFFNFQFLLDISSRSLNFPFNNNNKNLCQWVEYSVPSRRGLGAS